MLLTFSWKTFVLNWQTGIRDLKRCFSFVLREFVSLFSLCIKKLLIKKSSTALIIRLYDGQSFSYMAPACFQLRTMFVVVAAFSRHVNMRTMLDVTFSSFTSRRAGILACYLCPANLPRSKGCVKQDEWEDKKNTCRFKASQVWKK